MVAVEVACQGIFSELLGMPEVRLLARRVDVSPWKLFCSVPRWQFRAKVMRSSLPKEW
jgi:hypothetical protein